ncbi:MAG: TolC family protein [Magnetococcales bacterium]|nr:TolC family protein [Magnetococcales bacterium]
MVGRGIRRALHGAALAALLMLPSQVEAQALETLTLKKALEMGYRANLNLESTRETLTGLKHLESASYREMFPTMKLTVTRVDILDQSNATDNSKPESYTAKAAVTQPIFKGGSLWSTWKSAELATDKGKLDVIRQEQTLIKDIKTAWYSLLKAAYLRDEAEETLGRLNQHAKNAEAFFAEGRYWRNEVLQAQVKVAQGAQSLIAAENTLELAKSTLNQLLKRPLDAEFNVEGKLAKVPFTWTLNDAMSLAQAKRPDLESARIDIKVGKWSEVSTTAAILPDVSLVADYLWTGVDKDFNVSTTRKGTATITATWDIWGWGSSVQDIKAAQSDNKVYKHTYENLIDTIALEVKTAYLSADEAFKQLPVLQKSLNQAEENFKVNQVRYQEQLGTATDVLDALDLLTTSRSSYVTAIATYLTSLADLEYYVGVQDATGEDIGAQAGELLPKLGTIPVRSATAKPANEVVTSAQ